MKLFQIILTYNYVMIYTSHEKYILLQEIFIHIGASISRLFEGGELMDIKKTDNDGFLREFTVQNLDMFLNKSKTPSFTVLFLLYDSIN